LVDRPSAYLPLQLRKVKRTLLLGFLWQDSQTKL
jgi:hypothetical protein